MPVTITKRKPGRPPKNPGKGGRRTISGRLTEELRSKLQESAERNGQSLNAELEARLVESFWRDEERHRAFGGPDGYRLLLGLGVVASALGTKNETGTRHIAG